MYSKFQTQTIDHVPDIIANEPIDKAIEANEDSNDKVALGNWETYQKVRIRLDLHKRPFKNYVTHFLLFFDHPPAHSTNVLKY